MIPPLTRARELAAAANDPCSSLQALPRRAAPDRDLETPSSRAFRRESIFSDEWVRFRICDS